MDQRARERVADVYVQAQQRVVTAIAGGAKKLFRVPVDVQNRIPRESLLWTLEDCIREAALLDPHDRWIEAIGRTLFEDELHDLLERIEAEASEVLAEWSNPMTLDAIAETLLISERTLRSRRKSGDIITKQSQHDQRLHMVRLDGLDDETRSRVLMHSERQEGGNRRP